MSAYRKSEAPIIPEHLGMPRWHQALRCRVLGHWWQELFEPEDGEPFPAYCSRCGRTRPEGRSYENYFAAIDRYVKRLERMTTGYG